MRANPLQRAKKLTGFFVKSVSFLHFLSGFVFELSGNDEMQKPPLPWFASPPHSVHPALLKGGACSMFRLDETMGAW